GERAETVEELRIAWPGRREHLQPALVRPLSDRRADQSVPPTGYRVRPGDHRDQLVVGGRDGIQRGQRYRRRTGEHQAHAHPPNPSGLGCGLTFTVGGAAGSYHSACRIRRIASLRRSGSSRSMNSTPSKWSVSCWTHRAMVPVPTSCTGSPYWLKPLATTFSRRLVST